MRGGEREGWGCGSQKLSKNVHICENGHNRVKNGSPDMIPVAFERKFDENLNGIPPGIYRPYMLEIFQYWEWEV